jgi:hypothetical protein
VYVTIADSSKGSQSASNGGVLAGRDAVLIIEGHMEPVGAALEIEVARMVSKAAARGAVDTHFHLDHTYLREHRLCRAAQHAIPQDGRATLARQQHPRGNLL